MTSSRIRKAFVRSTYVCRSLDDDDDALLGMSSHPQSPRELLINSRSVK